MEGTETHLKYKNYVPNSSSGAPSILPSSSLRDILSLIFMLLALPQAISALVLGTYISLGLISDRFLNGTQKSLGVTRGFIWEIASLLSLDSVVFYILKAMTFKKKELLLHHVVIFANTVIACNLIGTSSVGVSVSNRKFNVKVHHENRFVNSNIGYLIGCFLAVSYVKHFIKCFNFKGASLYANQQYHWSYLLLSLHIILSSLHQKLTHQPDVEEVSFFNGNEAKTTAEIDLTDEKNVKYPRLEQTYSILIINFENFLIQAINKHNVFVLKSRNNTVFNVTLQPIWSILAALKTLLKDPSFFHGKSSASKNNEDRASDAKIAVLSIGDTRVLFKFMDQVKYDNESLKIKINEVEWSFFDIWIHDDVPYVLIRGLTSLFQYKIDIIHKESHISHFVINTVDNKRVLNKSLEDSSALKTLKISVVSTVLQVHDTRLKLRKLKKEESKKLHDTKSNIDNMKGKLSRYNRKSINESRALGKLKGLEHTIIQMKNEVCGLEKELELFNSNSATTREKYEQEEREALALLKDLMEEKSKYDERINAVKKDLQAAKSDYQSFESRHAKLFKKKQSKIDENAKMNNGIKHLKKSYILPKLQKRTKKI